MMTRTKKSKLKTPAKSGVRKADAGKSEAKPKTAAGRDRGMGAIPRKVQAKIDRALRRSASPAGEVDRLYERFSLGDYGLDRSALAHHAKVYGTLARWAHVGNVVRSAFGLDGVKDEAFRDRAAYMLFVSRVIMMLAEEANLSLSDLADLSKIFSEQRKVSLKAADVDLKRSKQQGQDEVDGVPSGQLPENFDEIVRRIYGTNFAPDVGVADKS